jgi:hypothetical protein
MLVAVTVPVLLCGPRAVTQTPCLSAAFVAFCCLLYVVAAVVVTATGVVAVLTAPGAAPIRLATVNPLLLTAVTWPKAPAPGPRPAPGAPDGGVAPGALDGRPDGRTPPPGPPGPPPGAQAPPTGELTATLVAVTAAAGDAVGDAAVPGALRTATHVPTMTSLLFAGTVAVMAVVAVYTTAVWLVGPCTCNVVP